MKRRPFTRINCLSVAKLIRYLQEVPSNTTELAEASGLSLGTVRDFMNAMEREGVVHVSDWEQDRLGRYCRKVYAIGAEKSCAKPKPRSRSDICSAYRARMAQIAMQDAIAGRV